MLALTIELLGGNYIATAYNDRERGEWPPHPARLFSALLATWAEGDPESEAGSVELRALRWLELQRAPEILASPTARTSFRTTVPVFVPVNDVGVVAPPDRTRLAEAEAQLAETNDPKARAKLEKAVAKLASQYAAAMAKSIAAPKRFGKSDGEAADKLFERRTKQPRTFPTAVPEHPCVGFVWKDCEVPSELLPGFERLTSRLVRLGHSSSIIRCDLAAESVIESLEARTAAYVPDGEDGDLIIRWVSEGQVDRLRAAFEHHRETEPRVLPAKFVRYREGRSLQHERPVSTTFSDEPIILARVDGPRLPITSSAGLSRQFRRALMSYADQPVPEIISGHLPDGAPSEREHLAVVPLPVVGAPHADGALIGIALVMPRDASNDERLAVMRALGRFEQAHGHGDAPPIALDLGDAGTLRLQRVAWGEDRRSTLRAGTWTRSSTRWASATPVALDRNPGDLHHPDAAKREAAFASARDAIITSIERLGLPRPVEVDVVRSCVLSGTAKPRAYPRFPINPQRAQRVLVHARLVFGRPVRGPILLGAGRYQGLGLCLPVDWDPRGGIR